MWARGESNPHVLRHTLLRRTRIANSATCPESDTTICQTLSGGKISERMYNDANMKPWSLDQAILPEITVVGDLVTIKNIRNFTYRTVDDYTPGYYDKTFKMSEIITLDFVLEPFKELPIAGHTLLSFGFTNGEHLAISVEIRKRVGQKFSPILGLFPIYELMYVIADECDVIKLRSNHRNDNVYLYPVKMDRDNIRKLFLDMLTRAQALQEKPEFYNTISSSCLTNLVDHLNESLPNRIPFNWRLVIPGNVDKYFLERGLFDTDLPIETARKKFNVSERARKYSDGQAFSKLIRSNG